MPLTGSCHCGKVAFEIKGELPPALTRCTCSFCSKRGQLYAYFGPDQFRLTREGGDTVYRWKSKLVGHHFCAECGCGVFSDSPDFKPDGGWDGKSRRVGVNARLIDEFDAATAQVTVIDGKNLW